MKPSLIKLQYILLTLYIAAIIIFKQYNFNITHFINIFLIAVFIILNLLEKEHKYKINIVIILYAFFIIISLASSLWGVDPDNPSFKSLQLFLILVNMVVIYNIVKKYNAVDTFFYGILIGSFINYLIMFEVIPVSYDIYMGKGLGARAVGTMGNPNILTTAMLLSMLVSMLYLYRRESINKIFYLYQFVNIFMAMYLILLTVSKKGILLGCLILFMYVFISIKNKKGVAQLSALVLFGIVIAQFFLDWSQVEFLFEYIGRRFTDFIDSLSSLSHSADSSTAIRKRLIEFGLTAFQSNPLLGYGLDNFRTLTSGQYAHNNPVELLVGVGLLGVVTYYSIHAFLLKKIYAMKQSELKYILYFFVLSILLMDLTTVSYGGKLIIFSMLYISIIAESENKNLYNHKKIV